MADLEIQLEYRDDASSKFWTVSVAGTRQTTRFGKIGTQGHTKLKNFASLSEAIAATEKAANDKRKEGYVDAGATPKTAAKAIARVRPAEPPRGGIFVKASNDGVTANAIAAKLRGDGKLSKTDPKKPTGFGADGLVGVAVHPRTDGYFAVVDSADGAAGIGAGDWSTLGVMANHLGTSALWYRVYASNLALGVRFDKSSSNFEVHAGDAAFVKAWLESEGAPVKVAVPPKGASDKAVLFTVKYEVEKYRSGPDESAAAQLAEVANLLIAGNGKALKQKYEALGENTASLALGILRSEKRGEAESCILKLAHAMTSLETRVKPKEPSFGEIILSRAIVLEPSYSKAAALIKRLDEIELDAEAKSNWAQTSGLWNVAAALSNSAKHARAHIGWAALVRRKEPHWLHVNMAVSSLLSGTTGKIALSGETAKTINACERRMKDLGNDAQDAILYNLACVYARAGEEAKALDRLARCSTIKKQNPNPEKDEDLKALWHHPKLKAIVGSKPGNANLGKSADDLELSVRSTEVLAEKGITTVGDIVKLKPSDFPKRTARELAFALEELAIEWGGDEDEEDDADESDEYEAPKDRRVPRLTITLEKGRDARALSNRIGGLPCAPSKDTPWPSSSERPMQLVAQLVGRAAGGTIDLGTIHVVQVFADMEGEYYDENQVIVHRKPCKAVLDAPAGCEPLPVKTMKLTPSADDMLLELVEHSEDEEGLAKHGADADEYEEAHSHAWCDKVYGIAVGANLDLDGIKDSKGTKMRLLLELTSWDDTFLWALFTNADFSEFRLEVVRG